MKNRSKLLIVLSSLVLSVSCASDPSTEVSKAKQSNSVENAETVAVADPKNKRVCKLEQPTGTRIAKKICKTQGAWDEAERVAQARLESMTKPQTNNPVGE